MKYVKMLGLAAVAAMALMAVVASSASATELTSPAGTRVKTGTEVKAENEGTVTLTTSFLNIECTKSTVAGKTTNESGATINGTIEAKNLTWGGCNCEVKTLAGGELSIESLKNGNGTLRSNGAEVTSQCNTIFGAVHCIYKTNATDLGTLTGSGNTGSTATMDIESANIPRLATSAICAEKANWDAKYLVTSPDPLLVD